MSRVTETLTSAECEAIAIFPLPRVVHFPATKLALHVFEPRYRAMMADCIAHGRMVLAMAQLESGWRQDYEGRPPIHPIAGAGRITTHRENPDGTYDLVLEGVSRVRLHELPPAGLAYRRARAELLSDVVPAPAASAQARQALWLLALQVTEHVRRVDERFTLIASPADPPAILADRIADRLVTDPDVRQELLETLGVEKRIERVRTELARLHLALLANETPQARTLH